MSLIILELGYIDLMEELVFLKIQPSVIQLQITIH
jgi:hypothetical protein